MEFSSFGVVAGILPIDCNQLVQESDVPSQVGNFVKDHNLVKFVLEVGADSGVPPR